MHRFFMHQMGLRFSLLLMLFLQWLVGFHPRFASAAAAASTCSKLYVVKDGDTCASISSSAKLTLQAFLTINPVLNCSSVSVGELICLSPCNFRHANLHTRKPPRLLTDYIGAIGTPITLSDVPIDDNIDQFLILAFAIDANASAIPQNGKFSSYWLSSITPESVKAVKSAHPRLKVLMSLAGYSLYVASTGASHVINWYDPEKPKTWLKNAVDSIGSMVNQYHLDGIDIDYETFPESKTFSKLIGKLIKTLKKQKRISIATIAPFESVIPYYQKLYNRYHKQIDYVNYQFYANNFSTVAEYTQSYNKVAKIFPREKLLASLTVGQGANGPEPDVFFKAFSELDKEGGGVPGMFLWSADHSKEEGFLVEKVAQCIL